jgi:Zn-dependent protease/CBS domain-containing protein
MTDSVSLGRIAGIPVGLNWSVVVLAALLVWTLAANVFPRTNPGLGGGTHLAMALVAAVLFALSILLHEFGHAVQARRDGMTIDGITLWAFGGVARFAGMFPGAGAEFRIAVAGPLVSLALGVAFIGTALVPGIPETVDGVAWWLGYTNIALLLFNLLPALPLDGGRMLRAGAWRATGDFVRATRFATVLARMFAYLLIGGGAALTVVTGAFSGLWLAFIGLFLLQAAQQEMRAATVVRAIGSRQVGDVMVAHPVTVQAWVPLEDFASHVSAQWRYVSYPVLDGEHVVGLLAAGHLERVPREAWVRTPVSDVMIPRDRVPAVQADAPLDDAVTLLQGFSIQRALVLDGDRLVGLLSITDVARLARPVRRVAP